MDSQLGFSGAIAGDWNSDGTDTIGVFRASTGQFLLRNSNSEGWADLAFVFGGLPGDLPVAGNWDGQPATLPPTPTPTSTPVTPPALNASFSYDGDGKRVKSTINGTTTYFVGAHYEVANGVVTKYYYAGAQRIARRTNGTLNYLIGDHLGSTSLTTNASGQVISELRYKAWGEVRYASGNTPTKYQYTGQFSDSYINLLWYGSRHYDPELGRFIQPDSIVPTSVQGVQAWDRYAYTNNNPVLYTDPSGHSINPPPCWLCNKTFSYASSSGLFAHDGFINNALDMVLPGVVSLYPGGGYVNDARDTVTFSGAEDYYPAMASNVVMIGADVVPPTTSFLRAGDRSATNPAIYKLRDSDVGSGLSTFDGSQVGPDDILSTLKSNDRVVEIPANGLPDELRLEFVQTQGTTGNPLLDQNHWELRDPAKLSEIPWSQYKNWWNDTIAPKLAELAKRWNVFK